MDEPADDKRFQVPDSSTPAAGPSGNAPKARDDDLPTSALGRLRLLVALDALLVEGNAKSAAKALDISPPAMSRLLAQLRAMFDDELVVRSARGMVATPFAEKLRLRLRALAAEASDIAMGDGKSSASGTPARGRPFALSQHPPLTVNPTPLIEGQPDPATISRRLSKIGEDAGPKQRLARYISTTGGGAGRPGPLTREEAEDAFTIILDGAADPIQVGALLVALQYRGVNANELAGMVAAARRDCVPDGANASFADLDWPVYSSPRINTPPWFLLSARLVASAGYRVLLHGFQRGTDRISEALDTGVIPVVLSLDEAKDALAGDSIAYMPLPTIEPQLQALLSLYRLFEMRSPVNMTVQLLNPLGAPATVLGVPSRNARNLQRDAARLLGWRRLLAVTSHRDVAQATPWRATPVMLLDNGHHSELALPATLPRSRATPHPGLTLVEYWRGLWNGAVRDELPQEIVISTAALALMAVEKSLSHDMARSRARELWQSRAPL